MHPYWVVDSLPHYWSDLPEPKLVFQTAERRARFGGGHDAWQFLTAWFQMIADRQALPKLEWQLRDGAAGLTVRVDRPVTKVRLWTAHSADRDFRDEKWTSRELEIQTGSSQASADVPKPAAGFTAFMAEVELTASTGQHLQTVHPSSSNTRLGEPLAVVLRTGPCSRSLPAHLAAGCTSVQAHLEPSPAAIG